MKISIFIGITIGLLLLALPAAASDFTLEVFGNANEDDTINMQDVTYTELIILEYRDQTELADGKYDGRINMQDVTQIELIILGRELELTIIDNPPFGKVKTIKKPVERVVAGPSYTPEAIRGIDATDKLIGITSTIANYENLYPGISKLPTVGKYKEPDIEAMLDLKTDIFFAYGKSPDMDYEDKIENVGINVVRLSFYGDTALQDLIKLGYILDNREVAEELSGYISECMEIVTSRTEGLTEDERPKVYIGSLYNSKYYANGAGSTRDAMCSMAGGRNIAADLPSSSVVDPEWLIEQNPEFIIVRGRGSLDDVKAARDEILNRTELAEVDAVKNGRVYVERSSIEYVRSFIGTMHGAKVFHPDLFEDLDPQAIHEEYLERFQDLPITYEEEGVFFYP